MNYGLIRNQAGEISLVSYNQTTRVYTRQPLTFAQYAVWNSAGYVPINMPDDDYNSIPVG